MGAPHYTPSGNPVQGSLGEPKEIRDEFILIESGIQVMNDLPMNLWFEDANVDTPRFIVVPWASVIERVYVVNSVDNTVTATVFTLEIAGVPVVLDAALSLGATASAGTVLSANATSANVVAAGGSVEVISDNGGSAVMPCTVTLAMRRT